MSEVEVNKLLINKHFTDKITLKNRYFYIGDVAHKKAKQRRCKANIKHLKLTNENTPLSLTIERLIKRRWSPEQISHCMKLGRVKVNGDRPKIMP